MHQSPQVAGNPTYKLGSCKGGNPDFPDPTDPPFSRRNANCPFPAKSLETVAPKLGNRDRAGGGACAPVQPWNWEGNLQARLAGGIRRLRHHLVLQAEERMLRSEPLLLTSHAERGDCFTSVGNQRGYNPQKPWLKSPKWVITRLTNHLLSALPKRGHKKICRTRKNCPLHQ